MLNARKKAILYVAVQEYILTAEPVSSQRLVEKYQLGVSSATVRHELAQLEELGYLRQPHTSAGRIPTDTGYRYYVDCTSDKPGLTGNEEKNIIEMFTDIDREIEGLLQETTKKLYELTSQVSVVLAPPYRASKLKHIDMVSLSPRYSLLVLITDRGQVLKRKLDVHFDGISLKQIENFLNDKLQGLGPNEISKIDISKEFADRKSNNIVRHIIDEIVDILMSEDRDRVYLSGMSSIFEQPEFDNLRKVQALLSSLEEGYRLLQWLEDSYRSDEILVKIGSENIDRDIQDCSLIATSYRVGDEALGTIGIIGPTRMNYARVISAVAFVAQNLTRTLKELRF
ncbi:MAG: heat-inducible transcription repressor HrcA [Rubrobacteridae bacterium]|nr:heat-inducible transcription repressor HrcA [Rubrobacteridae bacterium]